MHFGSYGLRKPWSDECLESPVAEAFRKATW